MTRTSADDLDAVIAAARSDRLSDRDIADLATALARSGEVIEAAADHADVASTGGPSSLSTLLCPLYLHALGARVAKLGVAGRPAGGVDVLATIPGYRPILDRAEVQQALARQRHVHLAAGGSWAPMDSELFALRQQVGAQEVPPLVIASLLAKKIALGVTAAGLDVRVAEHGNFGRDIGTARENARRFIAVAGLLGIRAICFLTDAGSAYQPYIGRGEALSAIAAVVEGRADGQLATHAEDCRVMASAALGVDTAPVDSEDLASALGACLQAHDTSLDAFVERERALAQEPRVEHRADREGHVRYDLRRLRDVIVERQRRDPAETFADPAGVVLECLEGSSVKAGELLLTIRLSDGNRGLGDEIGRCATIVEDGGSPRRGSAVIETVSS